MGVSFCRHFILKPLFSFLLSICLLTVSCSQTKNFEKLFKQKLLSADSILITSHEPTAGIGLVDSLINILDRPFKDSIISLKGCYIPRQTVFIFKGNKLSYIDICFHCRNFETSKDLLSLYACDDRKWEELENFFIRQGLTYELIEK